MSDHPAPTDPRVAAVERAWEHLEQASHARLDRLTAGDRARLAQVLERLADRADAMRTELDADETADRSRRRGLRAV